MVTRYMTWSGLHAVPPFLDSSVLAQHYRGMKQTNKQTKQPKKVTALPGTTTTRTTAAATATTTPVP